MTQREKIIAKARSLIGTKWRHRGRTERGIDCIGLVIVSLNYAGIKTNDRLNYGRNPFKDGLREELQSHCGPPILKEQWQPGDIVLMRWDNMLEPAHVGILGDYIFGGFSLIHSFSLTKVTEHILDTVWLNRIIEGYNPCNML